MRRHLFAAPTLALALWLGAATPAVAGDVQGTVTLPDRPVKKPRPGNRYPGKAPEGDEKRGPAIVFIEGVTAGAPFAPPKEHAQMSQSGRQFAPLALAILVGTTVDFPNADDEYHNVFSRSKAKEMELGRYGKGESRSETFDKPGLVRLRCEVHGSMHAVIFVAENPYFAVTDEAGKFTIKNLPPGKYRIYAFHEDYEPKPRGADPTHAVGKEIEVGSDGTVTADFDLKA